MKKGLTMFTATALVILAIFAVIVLAVMRASSRAVSDDVRAIEDIEQMRALESVDKANTPKSRAPSLMRAPHDAT